MIRRGQQGRPEMRRAERAAAKEIESDRGGYRPPDRADCHTKQWITPGDDTYRLRLQTITWRQQGRLMDFVINAQVLTAVEWETVEYVDCCHGHCHLHTRSDEPPRSISPLNSAYHRDMSKASSARALSAIDAFRVQVDWNLACGALADHELRVTSDSGDQVVVVAIGDPDDDLTPPAERPGATATVGMFLDYLDHRPNGVRLSMVNPAQPAVARDSLEVEFANH